MTTDQPQFIPMPDKWASEAARETYEGLRKLLYDLQQRYRAEAQPIIDRMAILRSQHTVPQGFWVLPANEAERLTRGLLKTDEPTCETSCD